jgi:hypothetical protein
MIIRNASAPPRSFMDPSSFFFRQLRARWSGDPHERGRSRRSRRRTRRASRAGGSRRRGQAAEARRARRSGGRCAQEAAQFLPTPAQKEQMQGVRGREHLPAPARKERMQGVQGGEHLPAPARKEEMQGVRGRGHLPVQAPKEPMQGVRGAEHLRALFPFATPPCPLAPPARPAGNDERFRALHATYLVGVVEDSLPPFAPLKFYSSCS